MEKRKITVVSTKTQSKYVIESDAVSLGELKRDLSECGIEYEGMAFYEGLTKSELLDDDSPLPMNVPYKGTVTNELVFMLTTPNKKIASGSYRTDLYDIIKKKNLTEKCLQQYGKNFTRCTNAQLEAIINSPESAEYYLSEEIVERVIAKLKERLPQKFSSLLDGDRYNGEFDKMFDFISKQ